MADHTINVRVVDPATCQIEYTDELGNNGHSKHVKRNKKVEWCISPDDSRTGTLEIFFTKGDGTPFGASTFSADRRHCSLPQAKVRGDAPLGSYRYRVITDRNGPSECDEDPEIIIDGGFLRKVKLTLLVGAGIGVAVWALKRLFSGEHRE